VSLWSPTSVKPTERAEKDWALTWYRGGIGLDLGCGGYPIKHGLVGIDRRSGAWTDNLGKTHHSFPDIVCDVMRLPYPDRSVDFVCALHLLEHLDHPDLAIREWSRVLKFAGMLLVVVPDWRYTFSCKDRNQVACSDGHRQDFTLPSLTKLMLGLPETELLEARVVCTDFSVGVVCQKI
jgi:SAM-dependent methyltransferase